MRRIVTRMLPDAHMVQAFAVANTFALDVAWALHMRYGHCSRRVRSTSEAEQSVGCPEGRRQAGRQSGTVEVRASQVAGPQIDMYMGCLMLPLVNA
jgi:hypothetical protein